MNVNIDLTQIVISIIGICVSAISAIFIPYIKNKCGQEKVNEYLAQVNKVRTVVNVFVQAAEQSGLLPDGKSRKSYVMDRMNEWMDQEKVCVDLVLLDAYVESAVLELHEAMQQKTPVQVNVPAANVSDAANVSNQQDK